jgi:hypothetical protein
MAPSDDDMSHQNIEVLDFLNIGFVSFVLPIPFSAVSSTLQTHPKHSTITQLAFTNVLFIHMAAPPVTRVSPCARKSLCRQSKNQCLPLLVAATSRM